MLKVLHTDQAPAAIGPYSQAIQAGGFIFSSGQLPLKLDGSLAGSSIEEQTRQVLLNLQAILAAQNLTLNQVVKTTIYLTDLQLFQQMNAVYAEFFTDHKPARSTVEVSRLPKDVLIEIEAIVLM